MNNKHYFPHDSGAHNDKDVLKLRMGWGWFGYGVYWAIVEILREEDDYQMCSDPVDLLAFRLNIEPDKVEALVTDMIKCELFVDDGTHFYSQSLKRRMNAVQKKRERLAEAGRKGGLARSRGNKSNVINKNASESKPVKKEKKVKADKPTESKKDREALVKERCEIIYAEYPRKVAKKVAIQSIRKALQSVTFEALLEAVKSYAESQEGHPDKTKIPHPSTWFNQERWTDDREEWTRWKNAPSAGGKSVDPFDDEIKRARAELREQKNNDMEIF